jgi:type I restriction enzyme R subunit
MTNFTHFRGSIPYKDFLDAAETAEKIIQIDPVSCAVSCRRAAELGVKWMYAVDEDLTLPYRDNLVSLLHTEAFQDIVAPDLWRRLDFIRKVGNIAVHSGKKLTFDQAALCLKNLYDFADFIAYCYGSDYEERPFDPKLLKQKPAEAPKPVPDADLKALIAENAALKAELTKRRQTQAPDYTVKPLDISEYKTRKIYIDTMLMDAGWTEGRNWLNEVEVDGMPTASGKGYADYVLYDDSGRPLAVIEAKKTCADAAQGRQQASLYADALERQYGRRPVIFLTNGFETRIVDGQYPERRCAAIYAKRDLEKWFNLQSMRTSLRHIAVNPDIAGRYYQKEAIQAVCDTFDRRNRRKALLVMATGSGKTRTVIALVDVLLKAGWIKNVLFLADRTALVIQAKRSFVAQMPQLSCTDLCGEKDYGARCVFSTYQTMINLIDDAKDDEGRVFTCGHFDLVICDEAHRSIYNKYQDIFTYFDAPLVGLTATPKDDIDKNTYAMFDLENGVPTYGYELAQAVKDGYLVDFRTVETTLKFVKEGIAYDELSDEDKAEYEATFVQEAGMIPKKIEASAVNNWLFNEDTIRKVLDILMTDGLKIDYGEKLGKTIIFAKNHRHAEMIYDVFHKAYPEWPNDFAKVIDNRIRFAQSAIDEFADPDKLPQIAISVDMLDTGIDVPEILNLVFFKPVFSKAKFWQMIGRGTRLCPGLIDGKDKTHFDIFDFCGNFEFFRVNPKGQEPLTMVPLQSAVYTRKGQLVFALQQAPYQTEPLQQFRGELIQEMAGAAAKLDRRNFAVRQHLKAVEMCSDPENYAALTYADTLTIREEVAPLMPPDDEDVSAVRFDALIFGIELALIYGKKRTRARGDLARKINALSQLKTIPEVKAKSAQMEQILSPGWLDEAGVEDFEKIRRAFRDLIKYIPPKKRCEYLTHFDDEIVAREEHDTPRLENDDLANYKQKAEFYVRNHQDHLSIAKLKTNKPLTETDVKDLEQILWSEVGSKSDYEKEYGTKPLGEFVREITGLDMNAAKEAFAQYLDETHLDSRQIYFVNQIVEYIVHNGLLKDFSIFQETPFTDRGSVVELFRDDMDTWNGIRKTIETINTNAAVS